MFRCVSCENNNLIVNKIIDGYELLLCDNCRLLFTKVNEKDRDKRIKKQYGQSYTEGYSRNLLKMRDRHKKYLELIHKFLEDGKILDVGCGTGFFLTYIKKVNKSWDIFGVEPNKLLRREAEKNAGINVINGGLKSIPFKNNYFDVVTCLDVLEHDLKLKNNVAELNRVLKPSGILLIQAPNYKSLMAYITGSRWDWWSVPDHVLHFSYEFLVRYMKENGFTILRSYTYEDQEDFLSNIKGLFGHNYFTKAVYYLLVPLFIVIERIGWSVNMGGLSLLLVRKN